MGSIPDGILKVQKLASQVERSVEKPPSKYRRQTVQMLEAQTEDVTHYLVLQRNIIPAHAYAAEEGATSDPHDQIAPQNICETMNSGWAIGVNGVDKNKL